MMRLPVWLILFVILVFAPGAVRAQNAWYESFEGPQTSWAAAGGDARHRLEFHQRIGGEAHTGNGCERLRVAAEAGTAAYMGHDVGRPRIVPELAVAVQVRADRPGAQLFARVVLPRSRHPQTGQPLAVMVPGSRYTAPGTWQQLRLDDVAGLFSAQLRGAQGAAADPRDAYIERVLLNVYCGPGVTNFWIDNLDVAGYVGAATGTESVPAGAQAADWRGMIGLPEAPGAATGSAAGRVRLAGSVLTVDSRPTFVRAIRHQGEPLSALKQMGFTAVWLREAPSAALAAEANQAGIWLISPPPRPTTNGGTASKAAAIGPGYDMVLAWDMGDHVTGAELADVAAWAEQVKSADCRHGRPLVCRADGELKAYSRAVDLLVFGRSPLGTSLELSDYGTWLRMQPRLAMPGVRFWTAIETDTAATVAGQWQTLGCPEAVSAGVSSEQLRLVVYTAVTSGTRGLRYESHTPLTAGDPATRRRAACLELLNLELSLMEPWLAAGSYLPPVQAEKQPGAEGAPSAIGAILQTDRAKLLVPLWRAPGAQFVAGQSAAHNVSFIVPGVPDSYNAYQLTPGGLRPLKQPKRVPGGRRVIIDEFGLTALVLFTEDPTVVNWLSQRSVEVARRAAELAQTLAVDKLETVAASAPRAPGAGEPAVRTAREHLQSCAGALAAKDYPNAYLHAERAMRPLRLYEREAWQGAIRGLPSPVASPLTIGFSTLGGHARLMQTLAVGRPSGNLLAGGDFEDLGRMLQAGWTHFQQPAPGVEAEADLAPMALHSGQYGLRLTAKPVDADAKDLLLVAPPIWMTTPPVPVEPGSLVVIHGYVQIQEPITGSVDGLMIVDSLGGEALAERIGETVGWREFTLYRAATEPGPLTVTFALSGLGDAWVDDVSIQVLQTGRQLAPSAPDDLVPVTMR